MKQFTVAVSCGEKSGDLNASLLIKKLKETYPFISFYGIGGEKMKAAGCNLIAETDKFGAISITESLKVSFKLLAIFLKLKNKIVTEKPDLLLCVDFGFFNTKLIKAAYRAGVKNIFYFPPGSWRKHLKHAESLVKTESKVITPFPWSEANYKKFGLETIFAGHPLIDIAKPNTDIDSFCQKHNINSQKDIFGFLLGSRLFEINMHIEPYAETINELYRENPDSYFLFAASSVYRDLIEEKLKKLCPDSYKNIRIIVDETYNIMAFSQFLFCCSGTATLEAAIIGTPMVILYKGNPIMEIEFFFRKRKIPTIIGMPNIILDRVTVPEIISRNVCAKSMIEAYKDTMKRKDEIKKDFQDIKNILGSEPVIDKIAKTFAQMANIE